MPPPVASSPVSSAAWWFRSKDGRVAVWQFPNPALMVWLAALAVGALPLSPSHTATIAGIRRGAVLVWALDELIRGASPFRRLLGAVVLAGQLVSLGMDW